MTDVVFVPYFVGVFGSNSRLDIIIIRTICDDDDDDNNNNNNNLDNM